MMTRSGQGEMHVKPFDIMSEAEWGALLEEMVGETLMASMLTDDQGAMLLSRGERYPLCDRIRSDSSSLAAICSQTNRAMLAVVRSTLTPVVEECEAGMVRIVIPVVHDGQLVGQVTACGRVAMGSSVETFLVAQTLGMQEADVVDLASHIPAVTLGDAQVIAQRFHARLSGTGK